MKEIGEEVYQRLAAELTQLEDNAAAIQSAKRRTYGLIRSEHGSQVAVIMKSVMHLLRKSDAKLNADVVSDCQARAIVQMLKVAGSAIPIQVRGEFVEGSSHREVDTEVSETIAACRGAHSGTSIPQPEMDVAEPTATLKAASAQGVSSNRSHPSSKSTPSRFAYAGDGVEIEELVIGRAA